jgi:hypothetical protein
VLKLNPPLLHVVKRISYHSEIQKLGDISNVDKSVYFYLLRFVVRVNILICIVLLDFELKLGPGSKIYF